MLREEEKIFCPATLNVGFAIHIQGSPQKGQDDGFKPTNQWKTLPRELKRVIKEHNFAQTQRW